MAKDRVVPKKVRLREERKWIPRRPECPGAFEDGEWVEYRYREDETLERILANAPLPGAALVTWRSAVNLRKRFGVHLIPGPLKDRLGLPVRQVYIHGEAVYRIESDGRVTDRLL